MSAVDDVRRIFERIAAASTKGDFAPFIAALDDDLEVLDHIPYRFERKDEFLDYLGSVMGGAESMTFAFHQPSSRVFNDDIAVVNTYDRSATVPKSGGAPNVGCGRTTLVFVKKRCGLEDRQRRIFHQSARSSAMRSRLLMPLRPPEPEPRREPLEWKPWIHELRRQPS